MRDAEAVFIAVGTPSRRGDGHADLSYVYEAAREIAAALDGFTVIITKSTVPVGTGDEIERIMRRGSDPWPSSRWFLTRSFCAKVGDLGLQTAGSHRRRVEDERAGKILSEIYRPFYLNQAPVMFTGRRTAELIKYSANAYLAMKVTFINEISRSLRAGRRRRPGRGARHRPR